MPVKEAKPLALEILTLAKEPGLYREVAAALSGTGWVSSSVAKLADKVTEILEKVPAGIFDFAQLADDTLPAVATALAAVTIVPDIYDDMKYPCGCCTVPDSALIPWNSAEQPSPESHRAALESEQLEAYMAQQKNNLQSMYASAALMALTILAAMMGVLYLFLRRGALRWLNVSLQDPLIA